ncbi:MAG: DUF177 domain-containing protein [Xanthomonadales bacterium]|nr:DUF177 domain-containing protein [Xanthomonadales bacterium]
MSHGLPGQVDVWRMVTGRRCFNGRLDLDALTRLRDSLAHADGTVVYSLEFDVDGFDQAYVEVRASGELPLVCQRTLEVYLQPVSVSQRLGLIRREEQEAALPPGYEPFLVPADGLVALADLVEDELILALPLVPARAGEDGGDQDREVEPAPRDERPNPFAALRSLKLQ